MATRSTGSEYQPSPPNYTRNHGKITGRLAMRFTNTSNGFVKPNMCCAPATNGCRETGLAPSHPASTKKMMAIRTKW